MRSRQVAAILCAMLLASCAKQNASQTPSGSPNAGSAPAESLQGDTWDSIKQLPDFSGAWTQPAADSQGRVVFEDCCIPGAGHAPLTPKYQAMRDAIAAQIAAGVPGGDNLVQCLPDGIPGILLHGLAIQYLFTPGNVTVLIEDGEVRRIHTDGRAHPPADELYTSVEGHSIGHWEGGTLAVDTIGMKTDAMLFFTGGIKVTKNTHVMERISLKDKDTMQVVTTIEDPEIFTKPYTYTITYTRLLREPDFEIGCKQNNRDTEGTIDLTPPPEE